jgi:hypothetical protein
MPEIEFLLAVSGFNYACHKTRDHRKRAVANGAAKAKRKFGEAEWLEEFLQPHR